MTCEVIRTVEQGRLTRKARARNPLADVPLIIPCRLEVVYYIQLETALY